MKKIDFFCKSFRMEHAPLQCTVGGTRAEGAASGLTSHHFPWLFPSKLSTIYRWPGVAPHPKSKLSLSISQVMAKSVLHRSTTRWPDLCQPLSSPHPACLQLLVTPKVQIVLSGNSVVYGAFWATHPFVPSGHFKNRIKCKIQLRLCSQE